MLRQCCDETSICTRPLPEHSYLSEASEEVALGFVDALERAYRHISKHPASGSSRYAVELNLPGLRSWPLRYFPHLVFYLENEGLHRHLARASHRARHSGLDARINHGSGVMLAGPVAKGLDTVTPPF